MALLFMDGFDCYSDTTDLLKSGWGTEDAADAKLSTTGGKNGGGSLLIDPTADRLFRSLGNVIALGDTVIISAWVKSANDGTTSDSLFEWLSGDGAIVLASIRISNTGTISFTGATGAALGTAAATLTTNTYHFLQWFVTFGTDATSGAVQCKLDGTTIFTTASIDTHTGDVPQRFSVGGGRNTCYVDDLVITDDTGLELTGYPDEYIIETLNVDSDGGTVDWTRNSGTNDWEAVDDTANAADDDTTYVASNTAAQETRFGCAAMASSPLSVDAVQIRARMAKENAGNRTVRGLFNVAGGGSEQLGETVGLTEGYVWHYMGARTLDLAGGALSEADVNAMEFGVEIVS